MEIKAVGIIGADSAGAGAAELMARNGLQVRLYDDFKDGLAQAMAKISWSLARDGKSGLLASIEPVQDYATFEGADLVIEAPDREMEDRRAGFARMLKKLSRPPLTAVNTSASTLKEILRNTELPEAGTLGFRFGSPVRENLLVEIVRGDKTTDDAVESCAALMRRLGRTPVLVKDNPGQILERLFRIFSLAALRALETGKGCPHEIDSAFREISGAPRGPFEALDRRGLDTDLRAAQTVYEALGRPDRLAPSPIETRLVQYGQLGRKATIGFYIYEDGAIAGENPILGNVLKYLGLRKVEKAELFRELMAPVIEEARLLASEIMASEYDIETVMKLGLGWPKGPFGYHRDMPDLFARKAVSEFDRLDTF
ncbi:MAG: 3-hydroxybutyryl-CoA dehydrogenase [Elusimicrobia bacterium]|nr:MAG: 3-hydroxybutyryl-CoA dehydrogenase [Elusimicrobiota bacterium]KAF0155482.1 MAG: 3-hydroxybutyryl-CoA dehydrogenase [Elusimicrobiota bacterium]